MLFFCRRKEKSVQEKLDIIIRMLRRVLKEEKAMSEASDRLVAAVDRAGTVQEGAALTITTMLQELIAAHGNDELFQAKATELTAYTDKLVAAIANVPPVTPPPVTPA